MRWSKSFIPTLKETPAEAEVKSHVLMLRAGMIRRLGSGTYSYLPLGTRTLNKVVNIIREEMNRAGAQEILMPALWPINLLEKSGRLEVFADDLMRLTDRRGREHALAPTHEEVVTAIARDDMSSYRDLPVNLYQIQTKFRDEPRPRFGVLWTREFIMKDAYSFDRDLKGLNESYQKMYDAYCRIFDRCGLDYVVVEAASGAMGGGVSHEFMVPSEVGNDQYVQCTGCDYAANTEKAEVPEPEERPEPGDAELKEVDTPGRTTIEEVSEFLDVTPDRMIKTLIYDADGQAVAALVRGDHEINETKLADAVGAEALELASDETIRQVTGAPTGFAGPVGLEGVKIVSDYAVSRVQDGVTGANKEDAHLVGVNPGRDYKADLEADIRMVTEDDVCPRCGGEMHIYDGIEVGHVFKLGTKYSKAMNARFLDEEGNENNYVMGCYGIGVNRILAAAVECSADENGMIWNGEIAPCQVAILPLNVTDEDISQAAEDCYETLKDAGLDVLLDDRDERPGFKFNDADLVGFPVRIIIGRGYKKSGKFEVQTRRDGESTDVAGEDLVEVVRRALEGEPAAVEG